MSHPNASKLEALAVGEEDAAVTAHAATCDACRTFVERAGGLVARIPMTAVLERARVAEKRARSRKVTLVLSAAAPLALAAAAVLFYRPGAPPPQTGAPAAAAPSPGTTAPIALAQVDPDTTFKGGPQLAIVRDRGGAQDRFVASVKVRPGDRLRIEVALDRSQAILGGVLGDDGSWVELMPEAVRDPGTHFSEKSVRIDAQKADGTILVGPPDLVRRARDAHLTALDGVRALHVEWEAP